MKNHPVLNFLIFTCFLVIGYTFSLRFYQPGTSILSGSVKAVTSDSRNTLAALSNGQHSILLIGASTLNEGSSHLESLWLATYLPTDTSIQLLPIFPSGKQSLSSFEQQLDLSFGLSEQDGVLGLDSEFISLLEKNNYWWSGYVIFDEISLLKITDIFSGLDKNGKLLSGVQVMDEFPEVIDDAKNAHSSQIAVLQAICRKFTESASIPDLQQFSSITRNHIITDLDASQLQMEWESLRTETRSLTCRFPTLEISRIEP